MLRTYIDWVLDLPWDKPTDDRLDPIEARRVLDEDHYDLDKVKERIVEHLAVQKLRQRTATSPAIEEAGGTPPATPAEPAAAAPATIGTATAPTSVATMKGPILCFVGPPGVGKTSLGQSIAQSDEPEVRPHLARRRTRRGRNPRTPPDLHRIDARPHRAGAEDRGLVESGADARRDRQDLRRHSGRSRRGAARSPRPGAEPLVPRPLPRGPARSLARPLHRDREPARHDSSGPARSHGDAVAERLHRGREGPHREAVSRFRGS